MLWRFWGQYMAVFPTVLSELGAPSSSEENPPPFSVSGADGSVWKKQRPNSARSSRSRLAGSARRAFLARLENPFTICKYNSQAWNITRSWQWFQVGKVDKAHLACRHLGEACGDDGQSDGEKIWLAADPVPRQLQKNESTLNAEDVIVYK
ncbi:hypothetical protein EK904_005438 [Melospiza melodia maxima]|nr:hypothetical protein EK904_005438 [Melospiza melodia maxima]